MNNNTNNGFWSFGRLSTYNQLRGSRIDMHQLATSPPLQITDASNNSEVVTIDVGGICFRVSKATLNRAPSNGILEYMNKRRYYYNVTAPVFIDADPDAFKPILNYMRTGIFLCDKDNVMVYLLADQLKIKLPPTKIPQNSSTLTDLHGTKVVETLPNLPVSVPHKVEPPVSIPKVELPFSIPKVEPITIHVMTDREMSTQIHDLQANLSEAMGEQVALLQNPSHVCGATLQIFLPVNARVAEEVASHRFISELKSIKPDLDFIVLFGKVPNPSTHETCEFTVDKKKIHVVYFANGKIFSQPGIDLLASDIASKFRRQR